MKNLILILLVFSSLTFAQQRTPPPFTPQPPFEAETIYGRVTDANGRGIRDAILTLYDPISGEVVDTQYSNLFGYYLFHREPTGCGWKMYLVAVSAKRHRFDVSLQFANLPTDDDGVMEINFVANL